MNFPFYHSIPKTRELDKSGVHRWAILILLTTFLLILGDWYYLNIQREHVWIENRDLLLTLSRLKWEQVENWRNERLSDAALIQNTPGIGEWIVESTEKKPTGAVIEAPAWMSGLQSKHPYESVSVWNHLGIPIYEWSRTSTNFLSRITDKRKVEIRGIRLPEMQMFKQRSGDLRSMLIVPIYLPPPSNLMMDNGPSGFVLLGIDHVSFVAMLNPFFAPVTTHQFAVLRLDETTGNFVSMNDPPYQAVFRINSGKRFHLMNGKDQAAFPLKGRILEGWDKANRPIFAALMQIPGTLVHLGVLADAQEVFKPLKKMSWISFLFIAAFVLALTLAVALSIYLKDLKQIEEQTSFWKESSSMDV